MLRRFVYRFYEARLEAEVRQGSIPHHVGVLPDGNRRFARTAGLASIGAGHRDGADNIERLIDWCDELGIAVITVWTLSTDNMNRPGEWLPLIADPVLGNSALDRLANASNQIVIDGKGCRERLSPHRALLKRFAADREPVAASATVQEGNA